MRTESLVDRLSQELRPVRRRSITREVLLLVLAVVEVAAFLGMGFMRPDMHAAMGAPSFWWKLTSMGRTDGPRRHGACRGAFVRFLGRFRLRLRLPLR